MMKMRKGMGRGQGSGWKNLRCDDSRRHSLASKGIKSAQKVRMEVKNIYANDLPQKIGEWEQDISLKSGTFQFVHEGQFYIQKLGAYKNPDGKWRLDNEIFEKKGVGTEHDSSLSLGKFDTREQAVKEAKKFMKEQSRRLSSLSSKGKSEGGKVINLIPREKTRFGLETGRVKVKFNDGSIKEVPVAMLKADKDFDKLSSDEMEKVMSKPYHGVKKGQVVEISEEEYWD